MGARTTGGEEQEVVDEEQQRAVSIPFLFSYFLSYSLSWVPIPKRTEWKRCLRLESEGEEEEDAAAALLVGVGFFA